MSQVAHHAGAYPGSCRLRGLGIFVPPLFGILPPPKVALPPPPVSSGNFASTVCTPGDYLGRERHCESNVSCSPSPWGGGGSK